MGCAASRQQQRSDPKLLFCRLPPDGGEASVAHLRAAVHVRKLERLIKTSRLAPLYPHDLADSSQAEDCPICTAAFPSVNTTSCCGAAICTQCFVYTQTAADPPGHAQCPYCKHAPMAVLYLGCKLQEAPQQQQQQQQQPDKLDARLWLSAKQRARQLARGSSQALTGPSMQPADAISAAAVDAARRQRQRQRQQEGEDVLWQALPDQQQPQQPQQQQPGRQQDGSLLERVSRRRAEHRRLTGGRQQPAVEQQQQHDEEAPPAETEQAAALSQLARAGLVPQYAAGELSGLAAEELDEILLEQALIASLQCSVAAQAAAAATASTAAVAVQ